MSRFKTLSRFLASAYTAIALIGASAAPGSEEYTRSAFAQDRNARSEALEAAARTITWWWDPYTGQVVTDPGQLDIDHVVPLEWAWRHGADQWTPEQRKALANDPENLIPVLASANRSKGSRGPDEWMPDRIGGWRDYLQRFLRITARYRLTMTTEELDTIACLGAQARLHAKGVRVPSLSDCRP